MTVSQVIASKDRILNVYVTAGFPKIDSLPIILKSLSDHGVDMIEVGMPYSDPLADGLAIQYSSQKALDQGMNIDIMFDQLMSVKDSLHCPVILMGYFNQLLQYGIERFLGKAASCGVAATIIPDLPMEEYALTYQALWHQYGLESCFLISPQTSQKRMQQAASLSSGFLYVVSQSGLTGLTKDIEEAQLSYFQKIKDLGLSQKSLIGFGIHDRQTMQHAFDYAKGAIVGSAFIRLLNTFTIDEAVAKIVGMRDANK